MLNTLLLDLHPQEPSTAQAACNLVRCALAAAGVALLQLLIDQVGIGWLFTLLAILSALCVPLLTFERNNGIRWRQKTALEVTQIPAASA